MLRLSPHHEASSTGVQLAENLTAWREFLAHKNEHGEPDGTRQAELIQARKHATGLQSAIETTIQDLNAKIDAVNATIDDGTVIPYPDLTRRSPPSGLSWPASTIR